MSEPVLNGPPKPKRNRPRIENNEIIPDISYRQIKTLNMIADEGMEWLPRRTFDFDNEAQREQARDWLVAVIRHAATDIEWSYRRATDSALEQAATLMRDPQRYERQKRRSKKDREKREAEYAANVEANHLLRLEREEDIRGLVDSGKLAVMPHLQTPPRSKPKEVKPPEDEA